MIKNMYEVGDVFSVQFAWQLPDGDYLRAVFEAKVLALDFGMQRYKVALQKWLAGRQESALGEPRGADDVARDYWEMVGKIAGKKIQVAFEADDGRTLNLKLATLTGENRFFTRTE
jgi:hypothetical protein